MLLRFSVRHKLTATLAFAQLLCLSPAYGYVDDYPGKQRVLMLGDSITMNPSAVTKIGIGFHVEEAFRGLANVHTIQQPGGTFENFEDTDNALSFRNWGGATNTKLSSWIHGEHWDVINFNTGIHDMLPSKHDYPETYAIKLGQVIDEIQLSSNATLIWREITYVPNPEVFNTHTALNGHPTLNGIQDDVQSYYNAAALPVVASKGITIIDKVESLSKFQHQNGGAFASNDLHYNPQGSRAISEVATGNIFEALGLDSGMRVDFGLEESDLQDNYYHFYTPSATPQAPTLFVATDLASENNVAELTLSGESSSIVRFENNAIELEGEQSSLAEDFVAENDDSGLTLSISGLAAGDYTFTGTFHDSSTDQGLFDVLLDLSGGAGSSITVLDDVAYSTGGGNVTPASYSFDFTADGANDFVISVVGQKKSLINGFTINRVPEASTLALNLIALLGGAISNLLWRQRSYSHLTSNTRVVGAIIQ